MFSRRRGVRRLNLTTDIHSHILPGIDDGSSGEEESLAMLRGLEELGLQTIWLTPHIKEDRFPNTFETISAAYDGFAARVADEGIGITLNVAAEYYIGSRFIELLESGQKLLTMKDKYILVEVSMRQEPFFVFETLYTIAQKGYIPILAHPERYIYYQGKMEVYGKLKRHGCLFQMNLFSLAGYYGKDVKAAAVELLRDGLYDFAATDIHNSGHLELLSDKNISRTLERYDFKNDMLG